MINSDPWLVRTFIEYLSTLKISKERLSVSLRTHQGISLPQARSFWARVTGVPRQGITSVETVSGKKKGKLQYGMCRVRVKAGIKERPLIQTAINIIGNHFAKGVV